MYTDYIPVIVFVALAIGLLIAPLVIQHLVSTRHDKSDAKQMSYECGEVPEGSAWVKFNIRFYVFALIFIIFDVEVIFMFPWATIFNDSKHSSNQIFYFIEMFVFMAILFIGLAYVWVKGDLDWVKMQLKYAHGRYSKLGVDKK